MFKGDHRNLDVWRLAIQLVKETYRFTTGLPMGERLGLANQMRRSAVSIPSNIAEGAARGSKAEFRRFLLISRGSLAELQTQLEVCQELGIPGSPDKLDKLIERLFKVLNGCIRKQTR